MTTTRHLSRWLSLSVLLLSFFATRLQAALVGTGNHLDQVTITATGHPSPGYQAKASVSTYQFQVDGAPATHQAFDANGALTGVQQGGADLRSYEWDAAGHLTAINLPATNQRTEFAYNGNSERTRIVEKSAGTTVSDHTFIWEGGAIAEERDTASGNVLRRYYAEGFQDTAAGAIYYYTRDHLDSIREVTDASGAVVTRYEYSLWGEPTATYLHGQIDADFGFSGFYRHQPSGLWLSLARAYDASSGLWLSRDPAGPDGFSLYAYVGGDPVNRVDPFGAAWWNFDLSKSLRNLGAAGYGQGGFLGNTAGILANVGSVVTDLVGGEMVGSLAAKSGAASGAGCNGKALLYGGAAVGAIAMNAVPFLGEGAAAAEGAMEELAANTGGDLVTVYRGTNLGSEINIYNESGAILSDAGRSAYLSARGGGASIEEALASAQQASSAAHANQLATWGSLNDYVQAHGAFGQEISVFGPRSMVSFTSDPAVAETFGNTVFKLQVPRSSLIPQTLPGAGESEVLMINGHFP